MCIKFTLNKCKEKCSKGSKKSLHGKCKLQELWPIFMGAIAASNFLQYLNGEIVFENVLEMST